MIRSLVAIALCAICALASAVEPRARDLGIPFEGSPGPLDAITDVTERLRAGGVWDTVGNNPQQIPEIQ